jgi:hypothetical protein
MKPILVILHRESLWVSVINIFLYTACDTEHMRQQAAENVSPLTA